MKGSLRLIGFILFICFTIFFSSTPSAAERSQQNLFTFSDTEFDTAHWDVVVIQDYGGSHTIEHKGSGGNPGAHLELTHQAPKPSNPYPPVGLTVAYINTQAVYDPAVHGEFQSISMSLETYLHDNSFAIYENVGFVARQNGKVFYAIAGSIYGEGSRPYWLYLPRFNMISRDFFDWPNPTGAKLDFSPSAGPIEFGFAWESTTDIYQFEGSGSPSKRFGIDNFTVNAETQPPANIDLEIVTSTNQQRRYVNQVGPTFTLAPPSDTLTVLNHGPDIAENTTLRLDYSAPRGFEPVSSRTLTQTPCDAENQICDIGNLNAGESRSVSPQQIYQLNIEPVDYQGSISLIAEATADGEDAAPQNNSFFYSNEIFYCGDLFSEETCPVFYLFCALHFGDSRSEELASKTLRQEVTQFVDAADLLLDVLVFYDVRDELMQNRTNGQHYIDLYNTHAPEILNLMRADQTLYRSALTALQMWEPNLRGMIMSGGQSTITEEQVDQIEEVLDLLSAAGSETLRQTIADERETLGDLTQFVDQPMWSAAETVLGPSTASGAKPDLFIPFIFE